MLAALAVLQVTATAASAAPLKVGEAKGVVVKRVDGTLVLVFTERSGKLYRRIAGKRITVSCVELPDREIFGDRASGSMTGTFRAPRKGRRLWTGDRSHGYDHCRVWLAARRSKRGDATVISGRRPVVAIPLTQAGAVDLDEHRRAARLLGLLSLAEFIATEDDLGGYPTPAQLRDYIVKRTSEPVPIVSLAAPTDTPLPGRIGYYSDGDRHAAVVAVSAAGRRLFIEVAADDVLHTNVGRYFDDGY